MEIRCEGRGHRIERVRSWASDVAENTMQQALCSARSVRIDHELHAVVNCKRF